MSDPKPDFDQLRQEMAKAIKEHSAWFTGAGFLFILLGAAAVLLPQLFTLVAEQFIGWLFLIGGIVAVRMLGGPLWFIAADLALAYLPMAYLGGVLGVANRSQTA